MASLYITSQSHNPSPSIPLEQFPRPLHSPVAPFTPGQAIHKRWCEKYTIIPNSISIAQKLNVT